MRYLILIGCLSCLVAFTSRPFQATAEPTATMTATPSPTPTATPTPTRLPKNIQVVRSINSLTETTALEYKRYEPVFMGDYGYVHDRKWYGRDGVTKHELQIFDRSLAKVGSYRTISPNYDYSIITNSLAYMTVGAMGLRIIDISNPISPTEIGTYFVMPPSFITPVWVDNDPPTYPKPSVDTFGSYKILTYYHGDRRTSYQIFQNNRLIYTQPYLGEQAGRWSIAENSGSFIDMMGSGQPNLVIQENWQYSRYYHIFELSDELRWLDSVTGSRYNNMDEQPDIEILTGQYYSHWNKYIDGPPTPPLILRYENGSYQLAIDLMKQPELEITEIKRKAEISRRNIQDEVDPERVTLSLTMLKLILTGHADTAWEFYKQGWPPEIEGQERFLADFIKDELLDNDYWAGIYELNAGKWSQWPEFPPIPKVEPRSPIVAGLPKNTVVDEGFRENTAVLRKLAAQKDYVYVTLGAQLLVIDVHNPTTPTRVAVYTTSHVIENVELQGNNLYLATATAWVNGGQNFTLDVLNIITPTQPTLVFTQSVYGNIVAHEGNLLYLAQNRDIQIFDLSNPVHPIEVGFYTHKDDIDEVIIEQGQIYIQTNLHRWVLLKLSTP